MVLTKLCQREGVKAERVSQAQGHDTAVLGATLAL